MCDGRNQLEDGCAVVSGGVRMEASTGKHKPSGQREGRRQGRSEDVKSCLDLTPFILSGRVSGEFDDHLKLYTIIDLDSDLVSSPSFKSRPT